jgi:hypothetical protein
MKAVCIDDSNKPKLVPQNEWIKEGEVYTIVKMVRMGIQDGKFGVLLKEVQMSEESFPYEYYDSERFLPLDVLIHEFQEKEVKEADFSLI